MIANTMESRCRNAPKPIDRRTPVPAIAFWLENLVRLDGTHIRVFRPGLLGSRKMKITFTLLVGVKASPRLFGRLGGHLQLFG